MTDENLYWWLGLLGSTASLIGLPVAVWQIYKTRRAIEAAKEAVLQTQKAVSHNLSLLEVSLCVKHINEIKSFVRYEKYEAAQIRIGDLISQLIQIQGVLENYGQIHQIEFVKIVSQLSRFRTKFEKKLTDQSVKINLFLINGQLDLISDNLNKFIGNKKIAILEERENG